MLLLALARVDLTTPAVIAHVPPAVEEIEVVEVVVVPAGCPAVPAGYTVDDYRRLPNLGRQANPHFGTGGQLVYTIGTSGADFIEGNALGAVVWAMDGDEFVRATTATT